MMSIMFLDKHSVYTITAITLDVISMWLHSCPFGSSQLDALVGFQLSLISWKYSQASALLSLIQMRMLHWRMSFVFVAFLPAELTLITYAHKLVYLECSSGVSVYFTQIGYFILNAWTMQSSREAVIPSQINSWVSFTSSWWDSQVQV